MTSKYTKKENDARLTQQWVALSAVIVSLIGVLVGAGAAISTYMASRNNVKAQYVALAIGVLHGPSIQPDVDLWGWAADVLKQYSEIHLPDSVIANLKAGNITLGAALIGEGKDTTRAEGTLTVTP